MNQFGGDWTKIKIEILVEYAKAYLNIMNTYAKRYNWKLLYFDGFAGSGEIVKVIDDKMTSYYDVDFIIGAAVRIIQIDNLISFDEYYFVEKKEKNYKELVKKTKKAFPQKKIFISKEGLK